ncbi:MAG TPA: leucyl/phenylalanyl-tRNA--protein transferase [Bacteroidales bacterium]|nr:leucyl/phenylalanyl-tRNA--protein transferase [Bacteroidales bacterium]
MHKVYLIDYRLWFPDPLKASEDGLLAIGGDLQPRRIILAYRSGIFPWYSDGEPIMWWSPDPRAILLPEEIKINRSIKQSLRNKNVSIKVDYAFEEVISNCANSENRESKGTWISHQMKEAYIKLHHLGYAHSVETYYNGKLAGGLYGISVGKMFCGESMFYLHPDASGIALVYLARLVQRLGFHFIDAQQETNHLTRMGARTIPRADFIERVKLAAFNETPEELWTNYGENTEIIKSIIE